MRQSNSLQETTEIYCLLANIKDEYDQGIRPVLMRNNSNIYKNPHTIPKLKKIQINRSLGLAAQNNNILNCEFRHAFTRALESH